VTLVLLALSGWFAYGVGNGAASELHSHDPGRWGWIAVCMMFSIYALANAVKKSS
jgi:hypothetical protein